MKLFEDRDIAGIDATVIASILILAGLTTINPSIPETTNNFWGVCYNLGDDFTICNFCDIHFDWSGKDCQNSYSHWVYTPYNIVICGMARDLHKIELYLCFKRT